MTFYVWHIKYYRDTPDGRKVPISAVAIAKTKHEALRALDYEPPKNAEIESIGIASEGNEMRMIVAEEDGGLGFQ